MAKIWGRDWTRRELEARIGHPSQLGGISRLAYEDGPARGMRLIEVNTGSGLVFSVHPDRCLDIPRASFKGIPIGWRSSVGDWAPAFTELRGVELGRTIPGGLLFTGGLTKCGPPCVGLDGNEIPLHGYAHSIPASEVGSWSEWESDDWVMRVTARVLDARLFGHHLELTRRITAILGKAKICIEDTIRNVGFKPSPLMVLHHCNFGAPLLSETARVSVTSNSVTEIGVDGPADEKAWRSFEPPLDGVGERVFIHEAAPDAGGWAEVRLENESLADQGLTGVRLRWQTKDEPKMWQWRLPASGEYVLGLEPTNAVSPKGQAEAVKAGQRILQPGESAHMELEFEVLTVRN